MIRCEQQSQDYDCRLTVGIGFDLCNMTLGTLYALQAMSSHTQNFPSLCILIVQFSEVRTSLYRDVSEFNHVLCVCQ